MTDHPYKNNDFVMLPRSVRDAYAEDNLNLNEFIILTWIWLNTNPVKGCFLTSPRSLMEDFPDRFSYETMRVILSGLRKSQLIYYEDRKGKKGSFNIYPVNFQRSSKSIQTWDYLKGVGEMQSALKDEYQPEPEVDHISDNQNHISENQNSSINSQLLGIQENSKITIPYNDNHDEKHAESIGDTTLPFKVRRASSKPTIPIPVDTFEPKTSDEDLCHRAAQWLGEEDMRPILKLLHQYGGFYIEKAWGLTKEERTGKIKNRGGYFTGVVRKLYEDANK